MDGGVYIIEISKHYRSVPCSPRRPVVKYLPTSNVRVGREKPDILIHLSQLCRSILAPQSLKGVVRAVGGFTL